MATRSDLAEHSLVDVRSHVGALSVAAVACIGRELSVALAAIHRAGDVHGALSPELVFLDAHGAVRLADRAVAAPVARTGFATGGLRYLAPEIASGGKHTAQSDLWSLGVTLWEAALGRHALPGDETLTLRAAVDGSLLTASDIGVSPAVRDAVALFVAPAASRVTSADEALAIFEDLCARHPDGRIALQRVVDAARALQAATLQLPRVGLDSSEQTVPVDPIGVTRTAQDQPLATTTKQGDGAIPTTAHDEGAPTVELPRYPDPVAFASTTDDAPTILMPASDGRTASDTRPSIDVLSKSKP